MSEHAEDVYPEGPRWDYSIDDNNQGGWRVVEEDRDHPALQDVDFFLHPQLSTDRLGYLEIEEGECAQDALRRHFDLPPTETEASA